MKELFVAAAAIAVLALPHAFAQTACQGSPLRGTVRDGTEALVPWGIYLDANVERVFALTKHSKANHPQTLTLNVRSSNVLNHANVTQVGGVLGSPEFGVPFAADNGRRVEAGARYSF